MEFEQLVLLGLGATAVVIYLSSYKETRYKVTTGKFKGDSDTIFAWGRQFGSAPISKDQITRVEQKLVHDCENGSLKACEDYKKYFDGTFTRAE